MAMSASMVLEARHESPGSSTPISGPQLGLSSNEGSEGVAVVGGSTAGVLKSNDMKSTDMARDMLSAAKNAASKLSAHHISSGDEEPLGTALASLEAFALEAFALEVLAWNSEPEVDLTVPTSDASALEALGQMRLGVDFEARRRLDRPRPNTSGSLAAAAPISTMVDTSESFMVERLQCAPGSSLSSESYCSSIGLRMHLCSDSWQPHANASTTKRNVGSA
ncbi:hypothetical protein ACHAXT_011909 [Thalassiosira profunda]